MLKLVTQSGKEISTVDADLLIRRLNQLLSVEDLAKDISYDFSIAIKGNEFLFGYNHLIESANRTTSIDVKLIVDGITEFNGVLKLLRSDNDYYFVNLESDLGVGLLATEKLSVLMDGIDIEYDATENGTDIAPTGTNQLSWPDVGFCFPCWQNDNEDYLARYNDTRVNASNFGFFNLGSFGLRAALNLALYVPEAVTLISKQLGYTVDGTLFNNEKLCKLFVWNNYITQWSGGVFTIPLARLLPDESAIDFFNNLRAFGISTMIDTASRKIYFDVMQDYADSAEKCDVTSYLDRVYEIEQTEFNGLSQATVFNDSYGSSLMADRREYDVKAELFDITEFGRNLYYNEDANPPVFIEDSVGSVFYSKRENMLYRVSEINHYEEIGFDVTTYVEDKGELDIPEVKTLPMYFNPARQLMPRVNHPVSYVGKTEPFDFKLLFFRGMVRDGFGYNYSFCSSDSLFPTTYGSFFWNNDKEYSLIGWRENSVQQKITVPFFRRISQAKKMIGILHGDWKVKSLFRDRKILRRRSTNFIWNEMEMSISKFGAVRTKIEMLKIS